MKKTSSRGQQKVGSSIKKQGAFQDKTQPLPCQVEMESVPAGKGRRREGKGRERKGRKRKIDGWSREKQRVRKGKEKGKKRVRKREGVRKG